MDKVFAKHIGVATFTRFFSSNAYVAFGNVLELEFINLSNVPVMVNGMWIDRYYAGAANAPTYLNTFFRWKPLIKAGEVETGSYQIEFQDGYYSGITPNHRLYVSVKSYAPAQNNWQE